MKDLESTTEPDFDETFNLNVKGPYFLAQVSHTLLRFHHNFPTDKENFAESSSTHGRRLPYHLRLHVRRPHQHRNSQLSPLLFFERRH